MIQPETGTQPAIRKADRAPRRPPRSAYWPISKAAIAGVEVLTKDHEGGETLPVFSHEEEAELFLRFGGRRLATTESRAGGLVSLSRERFMNRIATKQPL